MIVVTRIDGQAEALKLLRRLQKFNWDTLRPNGSARLVHHNLRALNDYPEAERLRFARVLSDWLVPATLGTCADIEEYEAELAKRAEQEALVGQAKSNPQLQRFLGKLNIGQRPPAG